MKTSTLPRIAVWLLAQIAPGSNHDALIGDLTESLAAGQSWWWMWRQVCAAVAAKISGDLRTIPLRAAMAITFGLILVNLLMYGGMAAWRGLIIDASNMHLRWGLVNRPYYLLKCYVTLFFAHTIATAIVAAFDGKRRLSLLSGWITFLLCWGCAWMTYCFQDPPRWHATIQLGGFVIGMLGALAGVMLTLKCVSSSVPEPIAPSN